MKKIETKSLVFILLMMTLLFTGQIFSQPPPPPPGGHESGTNQGPMGAPIDGGLTIFLVFAAAYTGKELLRRKKSVA